MKSFAMSHSIGPARTRYATGNSSNMPKTAARTRPAPRSRFSAIGDSLSHAANILSPVHLLRQLRPLRLWSECDEHDSNEEQQAEHGRGVLKRNAPLLQSAVDQQHESSDQPGEVEAKAGPGTAEARRIKLGKVDRIAGVHAERKEAENWQDNHQQPVASRREALKQRDRNNEPARVIQCKRRSPAEPLADRAERQQSQPAASRHQEHPQHLRLFQRW